MSVSKKELLHKARLAIWWETLRPLGLSSRAYEALTNAEIPDMANLVRKTRDDLSRIPGLGEKTCREIEFSLKRVGLKLGMTTNEIIGLARPTSTEGL